MDSTLESRRILPSRNYRDGCSRQTRHGDQCFVSDKHSIVAALVTVTLEPFSIAGREKIGAVG